MRRTNASASSTSTSRRRAASVSARYIAPVFTYGRWSSRASSRARVLLPLPAAPSMATTGGVTPIPRRRLRASGGARRTRGTRPTADSIVSISDGARAASADTANAIAIRWSPSDGAEPPARPPPPITRSSPSSAASPPSERIPSASTASRSLSFTRSSEAPSNRDGPSACAASAARSGTSSITSGSSLRSTCTGRSTPPGSDPHRPDRLSQFLTLDRDLDLQPHPPEHVEQTKSRRVQAHAPDREMPARERGGSEEERRGGRVSRHRCRGILRAGTARRRISPTLPTGWARPRRGTAAPYGPSSGLAPTRSSAHRPREPPAGRPPSPARSGRPVRVGSHGAPIPGW